MYKRELKEEPESKKSVSIKSESFVAKALGGRRVAASGASVHIKGDVIWNGFVIEDKTVVDKKQGYIIFKSDWMKQAYREAKAENKKAAITFDIDNEKYIAFPSDYFPYPDWLENKEPYVIIFNKSKTLRADSFVNDCLDKKVNVLLSKDAPMFSWIVTKLDNLIYLKEQ